MDEKIEKMVSFSKDYFTDEAWEILCEEFEIDPSENEIYGLILLEDSDELGLYNDNDEEEFDDEDDDGFNAFVKERENM